MQYSFEWDPQKEKLNQSKHKISFERAAQVFLDPFALSLYDEAHSTDEERWITLGKDSNNVLLVVVHTFREIDESRSSIRVISARKATKKETQHYSAR